MKRPPIEGIPKDRPRCPGCGKLLEYRTEDTMERRDSEGFTRYVLVRRVFARWGGYLGRWHSLRCALQFAEAAYKAGFRLKGREYK